MGLPGTDGGEMSTTFRRWLRSALPLLVFLTAVGIIGMHALASGHAAPTASPVATMHAAGAHSADTEPPSASAPLPYAEEIQSAGFVDTPPPHAHGGADCVPALLSTPAPVSAPATPLAIAPPPASRTGAGLSARAIAPPRPSLILLSISRT